MARAALGWGVRDLAAKADLAVNTVSRFENGGETMAKTLERLQSVLEEEGIDFPDNCNIRVDRLVTAGKPRHWTGG